MRFWSAALAAVVAVVLGCTSTSVPRTSPSAATTDTLPLALIERVADWQLAHINDRTNYASERHADPRGWIQGAFWVGLTAVAERSSSPRFADAIIAHGAQNEWQLGERLMHADDHVIGQSYLWAYRRKHDPEMIAPTRARFDEILKHPPTVSLDFEVEAAGGGDRPCQTRWCWSDALFMSPPTWAALSAAVGDPRYLQYADDEFWATTDYLYDREEHLYYRDSRFLHQRDDDGRKIFWSRGNGWVFAGIVHMLEALPPGHPSRARYEALLREMAAKLRTLRASGYWPVSLLAGNEHPTPETSGTGFFVYGLAWGVNHDILDANTYQDTIDRGWAALCRAVHPDGKLGWVQRVGYAPDQVSADDTQLYGVGAFLLAGGQIYDLRKRGATRISASWEYLENNTTDVTKAAAAAPWVHVDLPHTWNAFDSVDAEPGYRRDAAWYRRTLVIPASEHGTRHALRFDAANMKAQVYVNGVPAGAHVGGYLPFEVDITDLARVGTNTVMVRVDNSIDRQVIPSQSSDFVLYGGLTRDAYLITRPSRYIAAIEIATPRVSDEAGATRITAAVANFAADVPIKVAAVVRDPSGNEVARAERAVTLRAGRTSITLDLPTVPRPALWSPSSPNLYTAEAQLLAADGTVLHTTSDRFGYRWYEFKPHGAFYLNGKRLLIRGSHRHEEHAGYGGAVPAVIERADLAAAKALGVNFLRLAHYPQAPAVYRAADELGILLWDELPWCRGGVGDASWKGNTERMLREQIAYDRNHPSIIIRSLGNELDWLPDFPGGDEAQAIKTFFTHLNSVAKQLDPSRPTAVRKYPEGAEIVDVFSPSLWPGWYQGGYSQYESTVRKAQAMYPRLLHVEYGGDSHVGRHLNNVRNGAPPPAGAPSIANASPWDETYIVDLFDWYLHITERLDDYPGNAQWALKDFATPLRPGNPIPYINEKGLLDREGRPKEAYWVFKSYWTEPVGAAAFCHIYGHTWTERYGAADTPRTVRIYCNTPRAKLAVNGVDLGMRERDIAKFPAAGLTWDVKLVPGANTLEATGFVAGVAVARDRLAINYRVGGNGPLTDITLTASPRGDGLVLIEALGFDADGKRALDSAERVYFSLDGGGALLEKYGVPDKSAVIEMANGRASILYKPEPGNPGTIGVVSQNFRGRYISVSSDGCADHFASSPNRRR
jgi:beta-galactosidase